MVLTEEQQERIRKNRERALELQRERKRQKLIHDQQQHGKNQQEIKKSIPSVAAALSPSSVVAISSSGIISTNKETNSKIGISTGKLNNNNQNNKKDENDDEELELHILEDFEMGASEYVSKAEAKKMYCLPDGTLDVCSFIEKQNPHNKQFKPMKLYNRAEIRKRSRKRYGGLQGVIKERNKRIQKQFAKDLELTKNIFK